jgi:hypothetical protein
MNARSSELNLPPKPFESLRWATNFTRMCWVSLGSQEEQAMLECNMLGVCLTEEE